MTSPSFAKAAVLAAVLVAASVAAWETYLRSTGLRPSYDDGGPLWADKRAKVYQPSDRATVFIGSSRNKFDLDIDTWRELTGEDAVQLGMEGNSPLPVLDDLANDADFKGKLMIDVTEGLFFSTSPRNTSEPAERVLYFKKRSPAQRASFAINHVLESQFVMLDQHYFSMKEMLDELPVPKRPGVFSLPWNCPIDFGRITFDRQNKMTDKFLKDTLDQNKVKGLWDFYRKAGTEPPASGPKLDSIIRTVTADIDKIKARGGQVIFVRTPSSGPFLIGERMGFPRTKYWQPLLDSTRTAGIHFEDYPSLSHFQCPEFSHLSPADAVVYTKALINILQKDKGWVFPHKPSTLR